MIFSLPLPPSANRMYRRSGHVIHKSAAYRDWLTQAGWEFARQIKGHSTIRDKAAVELFIGPMHASRDADNVLKPVADFMQQAQIIANDKLIRQWHVAADCPSIPRNTVMVTIREMGREAA